MAPRRSPSPARRVEPEGAGGPAGAVEHLQRLMAWWGMLADLCFSDLLLLVPLGGPDPGQFFVLGQIRPTTSQTLHRDDLVERVLGAEDRPLVARCWRTGQVQHGELALPGRGERARAQCIPVRFGNEVVAVLSREHYFGVGRRPGELERVYMELFDAFVTMITDGTFPYAGDEGTLAEAPRVGDGVVVLDRERRITYASPNAVNALHRLGGPADLDGMRLDALGIDESAVRRAWRSGIPAVEEVENELDVCVLVRCMPLIREGRVRGAMVLLRDVTDLRRRDRLILSKDATIREIHHRVKNNLQTVSSLLRLQARRVASADGREALREAELRVQSMALVHEVLSREVGDQVAFDEVVQALVRMAEAAVVGPRPVSIEVSGDAGQLPADMVTPLAVVLTELLQNAVRHAFSDWPADRPGRIEVVVRPEPDALSVEVRDDGKGFPAGFTIEGQPSLGLSIVRDVVATQLKGELSLGGDGGAVVRLCVPWPSEP
ncbi:MAG TPA: histidine kinase N-terminal domain-containing protein [Acidimicrobiales bacterium]|nr:histidine kinase N-terminal domain-containing protein [Acidimicrobiales bacterium]